MDAFLSVVNAIASMPASSLIALVSLSAMLFSYFVIKTIVNSFGKGRD